MAKGFKIISIGVSLAFLLSIAGICYFSVASGIPPGLVIVLTAVFLTLFALGIWLQLFKRKEAAGKRMAIGSLLIYVGMLFLMVQFS